MPLFQKKRVVKDMSNGAIEVFNSNEEILSWFLDMRKFMEEMWREIRKENLELRRLDEKMSQELPMWPRLGLDRENAWIERDEDKTINRIFIVHERNMDLHDHANIPCDGLKEKPIVAQVVQIEGTRPLGKLDMPLGETLLWWNKVLPLGEQIKKQNIGKFKLTMA